jgi:cell division inhibitor SulA
MTIKNVTNRDNVIRIPYKTSAKQSSSITIEPFAMQLLAVSVGDAYAWLQNKAREVRNELMEQAQELERQGLLIKTDAYGNNEHVNADDFIRGKVSAQVRLAVIMNIAREDLASQVTKENNGSITNRDNVVRIQYKTSAKQSSSITIEPLSMNLLAAAVGDAQSWLQNKASQVRNELMEEAQELERQGLLIKIDKTGHKEHVNADDFIRGKVSAQVRLAVLKEIAREELVAQAL